MIRKFRIVRNLMLDEISPVSTGFTVRFSGMLTQNDKGPDVGIVAKIEIFTVFNILRQIS